MLRCTAACMINSFLSHLLSSSWKEMDVFGVPTIQQEHQELQHSPPSTVPVNKLVGFSP